MSMDGQESEIGRPQSEVENAEAKIEQIIGRPGVTETLTTFLEDFKQQPGQGLVLGITSDGLLVAIRENPEQDDLRDGYFKAWAIDATLPPEEMIKEATIADFSYLDADRFRGVTSFPAFEDEKFHTAATLSDEAIKALPQRDQPKARFLKKVEGHINIPGLQLAGRPLDRPTVGDKTLYPLPISK